MKYRRLGSAGLQLSEISLGSWVTFGSQLDVNSARECMAAARDGGINFFDNAEQYAGGSAEAIMGQALRQLGWRRSSFVVATKFFWGLHDGVNEANTLNRKYLRHAIDGSLQRLMLDYVDIAFCHRPDPHTPLEETVFAMHDMVVSGKALYWGTSEWPADAVVQAWSIAERHHLRKPVTEQSKYNILARDRVEIECRSLYRDLGIGITAYSPLASGTLAGRYDEGIVEGTRGSVSGFERLRSRLTNPDLVKASKAIAPIASRLGVTRAQLAIAWCLRNNTIATVITGASSPAQVTENVEASAIARRLDEDILALIDEAVGAAG